MMKRILCLCVVACLTILLGVKAEVKVENGAYQDVLLSFAPNVPSDTTQEQIKSLKELLESTSQALYAATGIRIGTVKVRLPSTWHTSWEGETISLASPEQTEQKPDILVDATEDSAFGKKPIALQHGGCTMPGHQIALPMKFVSSSEDYPKGKLLAREWLKYRYGVFDENGFEGDQMYPEYYRVPGSSDIRITECTNPEVNFYFKNPKTGNNCSMDKPDEFGTCKALPEQDANVTSSLMYFHKDLAAMEHICDRENHTHKDNTPSKHNTLCNGESIWDILNKSSDFTSGVSSEEYQPVEFSLIQDRNPRVVLSYENSDVLFVKEDVISLGVMRLLYDLPSQSKVGVYYFTNSVSESRPFADLSNRDVVNGLGDFGYLVKDICVSCALNQAVDVLLEDTSAGAEGTIILITHSKFEGDISNLKTKVENSRLCLTLIRFVDEESGEENLDQLKEAFPCNSLHEIKINEENGQSFENFYSYMNTFIPQPTYDYQVEAVMSGSLSFDNPLIIPMDPVASYYTLWFPRTVDSSSIQCKLGDASVTLTQKNKKTLISSVTFEAILDDSNNVSCIQPSQNKPPLLTQVQKTSEKGHYFDFDVWYHDTTPSNGEKQMPVIIYVKINYGRYPITEASVTGIVTAPNNQNKEVQFFDNGKGDPDITKHDGLYSGYFTNFVDAGDYSLSVTVSHKEGQTMIGKKGANICCGSQVKSEMFTVPSFELKKSIVIKSKSKKPDDGYPPSRILDLKISKFDPPNTIDLEWTAPGGGEASSYEFSLFCESEDCNKDGRLPRWLKFNLTQPKSHGEPEEIQLLFVPELPTADHLSLFFVIKSVSGIDQLSEPSNRAEVILSLSIPTTTTNNPIITDDRNNDKSATIGAIVGGIIVGLLLLLCIGVLFYFYIYKPRRVPPKNNKVKSPVPDTPDSGTEVSGSFRATSFRDRGSMRRVESFPVLLYTHDQIKDFKKKVDPPLYRPAIVPKPWMSMNVLSNSGSNKDSDCKSLSSSSTVPVTDKSKSSDIKQLDDISQTSEASQPGEAVKF